MCPFIKSNFKILLLLNCLYDHCFGPIGFLTYTSARKRSNLLTAVHSHHVRQLKKSSRKTHANKLKRFLDEQYSCSFTKTMEIVKWR